jgi:hypothetical protein
VSCLFLGERLSILYKNNLCFEKDSYNENEGERMDEKRDDGRKM